MNENDWPDEERIDIISLNGATGCHYFQEESLHYLDVKKQMLSVPTDGEVIEWFRLLKENIDLDMYRTQNGNYNVAVNRPNKNCIVKVSDTSYLDCLKQVIKEIE